jgi:hypothetical protein
VSDIFLSYARADKHRAELFAELFARQGWSVWSDREIPPGRSFDETIEYALNSARCVVVLWSQDSVSSRWVRTEAAEGLARGILVPVLIDQVPIPLEFKRVEAADLRELAGQLPSSGAGCTIEECCKPPRRPAPGGHKADCPRCDIPQPVVVEDHARFGDCHDRCCLKNGKRSQRSTEPARYSFVIATRCREVRGARLDIVGRTSGARLCPGL